MNLRDWALVAAAGGAVIAVIELLFIGWRLRADHDWNRRVTALRFGFGDDPSITAIRVRLNRELDVGGDRTPREVTLEQIQDAASSTYPEVEGEITLLLNKLEYMCVAIENRIADEKTCREMVGGIAILYHRLFRPFIEEKRDYFRRDTIYQHLEHYAHRWSTKPLPRRGKTG